MDRATLKRHAVAMASTVLGGGIVLSLLWAMNNFSTPPPKLPKAAAVQFTIEKQAKKPEPTQRQKPKPRAQERRQASHAPAPSIGTALSGLSFDLPAFAMGDLQSGASSLLGQTVDNQVMTAESVDSKPVARRQVQPEFPEGARRRGVEGFVKLSILIDTGGTVSRAKVLEADPRGLFEEPALAAVKQWEFDPPTYNGKSVSMWAEQTLRFRLN